MSSWQILYLVFLLFGTTAMSISMEQSKGNNPLPFYKRQLDKEDSDDPQLYNSETNEQNSNFVAFLINNLNEIFNDDDGTESQIHLIKANIVTPEYSKQSIKTIITTTEECPKLTDNVGRFTNMSLTTLIDVNLYQAFTPVSKFVMTKENVRRFREQNALQKSGQKLLDDAMKVMSQHTFKHKNKPRSRISCISCNNVNFEDCGTIQNKLIPSVVCKHEDDVCYSLQTPFGIVDRGCFNVKYNLTTYVCSCNLCNSLPINDLPYVFNTKKEWVQNVVELSRTRNFKRSVFKDMACLKCEVNATNDKKEKMADTLNCLEGKIGSVPTEICNDNEICGVKVVKSQLYLWRGCLEAPLYNYWMTLCNSDLCTITGARSGTVRRATARPATDRDTDYYIVSKRSIGNRAEPLRIAPNRSVPLLNPLV